MADEDNDIKKDSRRGYQSVSQDPNQLRPGTFWAKDFKAL
jgi:hypothetical protein